MHPSTEDHLDDLETFWAALLSRQPERILAAFHTLSAEEKEAVLVHLKRMAEENGWHPQQRASARTALQVLKSYH